MKRRAYHFLTLPDGRRINGPVVVCFDDDEKMLSWHLLDAEEPSTEWIGGHFDTRKREKNA